MFKNCIFYVDKNMIFCYNQAIKLTFKIMIRNKKYNSFLGKTMYDHIVPQNHFLRKVNETINWIPLMQKITPCYKGGFELGASAINPVTVLKTLFLSYLYDLSERQTEVMCNENIAFKYFIEISLDERAPDHSTISKFRTRLIKYYRDEGIFEKLFEEVLMQIMNAGIKPGNIQIVDSKHMNARVSQYRKTKRNEDKSKKDNNSGGYAGTKPKKQRRLKQEIDPDAGIVVKGGGRIRNKEGKWVQSKKYYFGYKAHCSIENNNDLITSCILTSGSESDGNYFEPLLWKDMTIRGKPRIYSADKGYDWGDHHYLLNWMDIGDAIILNDYRLADETRYAIWHKIYDSDEYKEGKKERFKVERTFGQCTNNLGINDCRYFGRIKTAFQMYFTAMAYNLTKALKVLYGLSPRTPVPVRAF